MMEDCFEYLLSPAQLHAVTREKFRIYGWVAIELTTVNFGLIKKYCLDREKVPPELWAEYYHSLEMLCWAADTLAEELVRSDDWSDLDDHHDCYAPFRVGRTFSKASSESTELVFDNGDCFASYHDAAGYYSFEFADAFLCCDFTEDEKVIPVWERLLGKADIAAKWERFFSRHLSRFIAGLNAEAAGAIRFFGDEKFNATPIATVAPKRTYNRFAKPCPKCEAGKMTVGTKKGNGVRHLYCNACAHSEKATRPAAARSNVSQNGTQLEQ